MSNEFIFNFRFEASEVLSGSIVVELSLLEGKNIQNIATFQLLLVQISDSICCFLPLALLDNIYVAAILEIGFNFAR